MVSRDLGKMLLIVACALGVLQGLLTLIGGCIAVNDKHKDLNDDSDSLAGILPAKYSCGGIRYSDISDLTQFSNKDEKCGYDKMDRGWFQRVHDFLKDDEYDYYKDDEVKDLYGWGAVLGESITCGVGWIISGALAIVAFILTKDLIAFAAAGAFAVFYIIFIVLFSIVWHSAKKISGHCLDKICKDMRRHGKRSSREFLAYGICAFILILGAIICSVLGALSLSGSSSNSKEIDGTNGTNRKFEDEKDYEKKKNEGVPPAKSGEEKKSSEVHMPEKVSSAGSEYIAKFKQLNKYIADKNKMDSYADKKFKATDKDKSGALDVQEFKKFVSDIMAKKKLPPPNDKKIQALINKYDADGSGKLEKNEFQQMLLEIFLESREILILKYAAKKAESWKSERSVSKTGSSNIKELDDLLKDTEKLYEVLVKVSKHVDQNSNSLLDLDEVTDMIKLICEHFKVTPLNKNDIVEVMFDMDRAVKEYDIHDLRMVSLATLAIASNLAK